MRINPISKANIMVGGSKDKENKQTALKNIKKGLDQVAKGYISSYYGSNKPSQILQQLLNADPSSEKVYTLWLASAFSKDPQTTLDDLTKGKEALSIIYAAQQERRTPQWAQSLPSKKYPTIAKLRTHMLDKKVLKKVFIAKGEWEKILKKMINEGEAQIIIDTDDVMFIDEITQKAAEALGGKKPDSKKFWTDWCTGRGAFGTYKLSGLFIMYPKAGGANEMVQISATDREGTDENGVFHEAKDISDEEINWDDYPNEWLKLAKKAQKIVQARVKALTQPLPIFAYLKNPNAKIFDILKEYYSNSKLLPIDYLAENKRGLIEFFNNPSLDKMTLMSSIKTLEKNINKDMLMVHVLVTGFENLPPNTFNVDMKDIPGGVHQFQFDEQVILDPFEMNAYETTNALWLYVMGLDAFERKDATWADFTPLSAPVVYVSWYDCINFCNKMSEQAGLQPCYEIDGDEVDWIWNANGFRLPSEAEWEAAARARKNFKYAGSDDPDKVAWYSDNSGGRVHKVGQKKPNSYGLYDMSGNVSEWVYDSYGAVEDKEEQPLRDRQLAAKFNRNPRRRRNG